MSGAEPPIEMMERHVREAEARVMRQRAVVERLAGRRLPVERAKGLLVELERAQSVQKEHLATVRAEQRLGLRDSEGVLIESQASVMEQLAALQVELAAAPGWGGRLRALIQITRRLLKADGVSVAVREDGLCQYVEEDAIGPLWKGRMFPLEDCVSGWVILNRTPAIVADIRKDERVPAEAYRTTFVRSLLLVPVGGGEQAGAALGAYWASEHQASEDEVLLLTRIARVLSGVLA